jgi:CIC family chloride channel protein
VTTRFAGRIVSFIRSAFLPRRWAEQAPWSDQQVGLLLWAGVVGAAGAILASGLRWAGDAFQDLLWGSGGGITSQVAAAPQWMRLVLPAAGGIVAGAILVYGLKMARTERGWGILEAVVLRDGVLKFRPAMVNSLSSLITIATGGSVGREGPMVLLSSTMASKIGQWLDFPTRHLRILTAAGLASGIASAYNAPIGASLFAMEIILGNFAMEVFAPLVAAAVVATLVARGLYGGEPVFHVPPFEMVSLWEIGIYVLLGVAGGLLAAAFLGALRTSARFFNALPLGRPVAMGLVGLLLGVVILWYPEVCGGGRGLTDAVLDASYMWRLATALLVLKLVMTALTVGSGGVGGVFTPALFVGAALGYSFGTLAHFLAPASTANPAAYALVGMGCLLAGTTHAPIMAILMIFEMSLNYSIVLPLMLSTVTASLVARAVSPRSVYTEALSRKGAAPMTPEAQVMTSLCVKDIMRREFESAPPDLPLPRILDVFIKGRRNHLYVVDGDGRFLGAIGLHDLKETLRESEDVPAVIALDLVGPSFELTVPEEHLDKVMERLWSQDCERIPVVDSFATRKILGTVSKRDILGVYTLEVLHRKSMMTKFHGLQAEDSAESPYVELPEDYRVDGVKVGENLAGRTVAESGLRDSFDVTVLLIRRRDASGRELRLVPKPETHLRLGDRLVVYGPDEGLARLMKS